MHGSLLLSRITGTGGASACPSPLSANAWSCGIFASKSTHSAAIFRQISHISTMFITCGRDSEASPLDSS